MKRPEPTFCGSRPVPGAWGLIRPSAWVLGPRNAGGAGHFPSTLTCRSRVTKHPASAWNVLCPGKLLSAEQTAAIGHPIKKVSKTRIVKECFNS